MMGLVAKVHRQFYPSLSLEISIDLPFMRSIVKSILTSLSEPDFGNFHRSTSVGVINS